MITFVRLLRAALGRGSGLLRCGREPGGAACTDGGRTENTICILNFEGQAGEFRLGMLAMGGFVTYGLITLKTSSPRVWNGREAGRCCNGSS